MLNRVIKPSIILMLIAFVSSLVLSHVKRITDPSIKKQARKKEERALKLVLPGFKIDTKKDLKKITINGKTIIFWAVSKKVKEKNKAGIEEEIVKKAYAFKTALPGYSGDIESMVGVTSDGKILGISILHQTETPGLGARCMEIASKITFFGYLFGKSTGGSAKEQPWFQKQFKGLQADKKISIVKKGDWKPSMKKQLQKTNSVTCITGATITTRTVTDSIAKQYKVLKQAVKKLKIEEDTRK